VLSWVNQCTTSCNTTTVERQPVKAPSKIHNDPSIFVFRMTHSIGKVKREDSRMLCNHAIRPSTRRTKRTWAKPPGKPGPRGLPTSEMIQSEPVDSPGFAAFGAQKRRDVAIPSQRGNGATSTKYVHSMQLPSTQYVTQLGSIDMGKEGRRDRKRSGTKPPSPKASISSRNLALGDAWRPGRLEASCSEQLRFPSWKILWRSIPCVTMRLKSSSPG
jgi:hypothetical protein